MIFVTVGSMNPFDRLVRTMDEWAMRHARRDVFAQIGNTQFRPAYIDWVSVLDPQEFRTHCSRATLIVAHAGMGTIITALEMHKPLIVLPRRGHLRETRNDHQIATAHWLKDKPGIAVAESETDLERLLGIPLPQPKDQVLHNDSLQGLIGHLRTFIRT